MLTRLEHYEQRAAVPGTLLITEATFISRSAVCRNNGPGIYSEAQIARWKEVTDAVHKRGSFIYCQIWHLGRAGVSRHSSYLVHPRRWSGYACPLPVQIRVFNYIRPQSAHIIISIMVVANMRRATVAGNPRGKAQSSQRHPCRRDSGLARRDDRRGYLGDR